MSDAQKQALWAAIRNRDYAGAFRVLRTGAFSDVFCPQSFFAPDPGDSSGSNLLHVAVETGDTHCVRLLLNSGARDWVGRPDAQGRNVFHRIALRDDWKMLFVFSGVPRTRTLMAAQDAQGRTPLHYVCLQERADPRIGARMNEAWRVRDKHGKLAEEYAKSSGKESLHVVLRQLRKNWEWREKERMRRTQESGALRSQGKARSGPLDASTSSAGPSHPRAPESSQRAAQRAPEGVGEASPFGGLEQSRDFEELPAKEAPGGLPGPVSRPPKRRQERRPGRSSKPAESSQPATNQMDMF